ncbi:hypothetical protein Tco_0999319 [Tanacetum coccineum]
MLHDAIKIGVDLEELEILKRYKAFKFKISAEMKDDRKCFESCRCKRFYQSSKIAKVDAEKKENGKYIFFVTLDNNQKCYFPIQNLKNLGYEEILLCLHNSKIKKEIKNRLKVIVQKLPIQAEMWKEITKEECYQVEIGLSKSCNKMMLKEVLNLYAENVPNGIQFKDIQYYDSPVQGFCFLNKECEERFICYDNVTLLPVLQMVALYKLYTDDRNKKMKEKVLRAFYFQKNSFSKHPAFKEVLNEVSTYRVED